MSGLPEGWATTKLGTVLEFKYGKGLPKEKRHADGTVNVFGSNGIVGVHDHPVSPGPTIIVGRKGSVGEVHLSHEACWPIDTTYYVDEFPNGLPPEFWVFYLKHLRLGQQEKSSAIPGISREDIYATPINIPPPSEQPRIVEKVEALLAKVRASRERLDKIPRLLKRFRQAVLAAACSGKLTADLRPNGEVLVHDGDVGDFGALPATWSVATLASVCENIVDCPHSTPKWATSGRICVRTTNFRLGKLDLSETRFVSEATYQERIARLRPQPNDILYSREGGILGIACLVPSGVDLCLGQRMMLFRASPKVDSGFLMNWLNSPVVLQRVKELTGGTASPHLNVADIKRFPVPLPPPEEQRQIVRRVESMFHLADRLQSRYENASKHTEKLTQSILAKAFRGELVPTEAELARKEGRTYETAEELLVRIKTANASQNRGKTRGKRLARSSP